MEKKKIFFLSSFQLQDSQVTELKPKNQHRIIGDKDERDRTKHKQESTRVCIYHYIKLCISTAWPN